MILLSFDSTPTVKPQIIMIFGSGLIGSAVVDALEHTGRLLSKQQLSWCWPSPTRAQTQDVEAAFQTCLNHRPSSHLTVIWAAGRSGFGSSEDDMSAEYQAFCGVQTFAQKLGSTDRENTRSFIHISSAGGLFEGQIACDTHTAPCPIRPYGHGKLAQEISVQENAALGRRLVVRPSSVFGYVRHGRLGLISALISAARQHRTATIFGAFNTQRDFIFAPDIGRYIAQKIFIATPKSEDFERVIMASGRPASVFEIINTIEDVIGVPLYLKINAHPDNALDNTFRMSALPPRFCPTPLREGIEQTKTAMEANSF